MKKGKMRQIKLRAWDKKTKKMFDWNSICDGVFTFNDLKFDFVIWMQFIGLTDKNHKEIYEGDIMYCAGIGNMEVIFRNGAFCLYNGLDVIYFNEDMEQDIENVIGNIYENPELLEKK